MRHLEALVTEYKARYEHKEHFDDTITGEIKRVRHALLDERFAPSMQLKTLFDKLLRRSIYPMEVAIVGQFSSGKSTFLNALLSKDVLPTGITPVTSKVNFINYDSEYKLKVTYKNGAQEYHALENIAKFTDQRKSVEDIKYLTLYAPMDILKDISFVDTPGLNSQSQSDTETTKRILRDVDGIIWLTLIDNAGKESETEVLSEYLENFKDKSLCVLNQKDKFTQDQVQTTVDYIQEQFSTFFSQVIPISARQALDSRVHRHEVLLENALHLLQNRFKEASSTHTNAKDLDFFKDDFEHFYNEANALNTLDRTDDKRLLEESNITSVLDFIEHTIRPQATQSKAYALKKDMHSVCDILIKEYETILGVYESLEAILRHKEDEILKAFDNVYLKHSRSLYSTHAKVENILQTVASTIYTHIKYKKRVRVERYDSFFSKDSLKEHEYEALWLDTEAVLQTLFYEDQAIDKQIKATISYFKQIAIDSSEDLRDVFRILKNAIQTWQAPYELIKKHREIASDLEFATTRQFVSKVYEHTILPFHRAIVYNIMALHKKFAFFNGALSFSYKQIIQESLLQIEQKLDKQTLRYESDPLKHTMSKPNDESILEALKANFTFDKIEAFLTSRRNYLYKIIETSKVQFVEINSARIDDVLTQKRTYIDKIEAIKEIQKSLRSYNTKKDQES